MILLAIRQSNLNRRLTDLESKLYRLQSQLDRQTEKPQPLATLVARPGTTVIPPVPTETAAPAISTTITQPPQEDRQTPPPIPTVPPTVPQLTASPEIPESQRFSDGPTASTNPPITAYPPCFCKSFPSSEPKHIRFNPIVLEAALRSRPKPRLRRRWPSPRKHQRPQPGRELLIGRNSLA